MKKFTSSKIFIGVGTSVLIATPVAAIVGSHYYNVNGVKYINPPSAITPAPEISVKPFEIKFNANGKLLIPELIDTQIPDGNYEHKIEKFDTIKYAESNVDIESPEYIKEFNIKKVEGFNGLLNNFSSEELKLSFEMNDTFVKVIKNFVPSFSSDKTNYNIQDLIESIYNSSLNEYSTKTINFDLMKDLLALNNIKIEKNYNDVMNGAIFDSNNLITPYREHNNIECTNDRCVCDITPAPQPPPILPPTDIPTDFSSKSVEWLIREMNRMNEDLLHRTIATTILTAAQITIALVAMANAFWSFGLSLIWAAVELGFCAFEIVQTVREWEKVCETRNKWWDICNSGLRICMSYSIKKLCQYLYNCEVNSLNWILKENLLIFNKEVKHLSDFLRNNVKLLRNWRIGISLVILGIKSALQLINDNQAIIYQQLIDALNDK